MHTAFEQIANRPPAGDRCCRYLRIHRVRSGHVVDRRIHRVGGGHLVVEIIARRLWTCCFGVGVRCLGASEHHASGLRGGALARESLEQVG